MRYAWFLVVLALSGCASWDMDPRADHEVSVAVFDDDGTTAVAVDYRGPAPLWLENFGHVSVSKFDGVTTRSAAVEFRRDATESAGLFRDWWGRLISFLAGVFVA